MNTYQKNLLSRALTGAGIESKEAGDELNMRCPICSPRYSNRRLTLAFNVAKDAWHCWRCDNAKGRDIKSFLFHVGLFSYAKSFDDATQTYYDTVGLNEVRRRLLEQPTEETKETKVASLPDGYRTDFEQTITGRAVLRYLRKRHVGTSLIKELKVGYAIEGDCNGSAIFPVIMNGNLVFWQARKVLFQTKNKYYSSALDKSVLYGYDWIGGSSAYIVEGIFDAIALKPYSLGILGKTISNQQIALLAEKNITDVSVVLDGDAWDRCRQLARQIRSKLWTVKRVKALRLDANQDPGDFMCVSLKVKETAVF